MLLLTFVKGNKAVTILLRKISNESLSKVGKLINQLLFNCFNADHPTITQSRVDKEDKVGNE